MKLKTLVILAILLILIVIPLLQPTCSEESNNLNDTMILEEEYPDINHHQESIRPTNLKDFNPTFKLQPSCLETKNYTSFPITDQSILSKQFEVPKLSFPLDKMPPNSLDLQKCFGNQVISCYKSTIQNSAYNVNDLCNCNGYTVANVNPYLKENKAENTLLQMDCQLSTNN